MSGGITILDYLHFDCPTTEQKQVLLEMSDFIKESSRMDFFILCGAAGTGKTSITTALIGYLNTKDIVYNIAAPTGRAARILGRKSNTINSTIHSLIYSVKSNPKNGEVVFQLKHNEEKEFSVFIIDEASMISSKKDAIEGNIFKSKNALLADLIRFVKNGNPNNKIIFLGDKNQLPPVNEKQSLALSKPYLCDTFNLEGISKLLTTVKRQEDGSYILKNANLIKKGIESNMQKVPLIGVRKQSINEASKTYLNDYKSKGQDAVISIGATHKMNMMFNSVIRSKIYGRYPKSLMVDDLLLISQTWRRNDIQLYSGDHVVVKEVNLNEIETVAGLSFVKVKLLGKNLEGKEEEIVDYLLLESIQNPQGLSAKHENALRHERFKKNKVYRESGKPWDDRYVGAIRATYGHSITCNKAQGGEWDRVFINSYFMPSLKFQYTAITRAKQDVLFY
ncbi:AAA family ATPase [Formosa sediminum]|uniref:AAA family ATPase n=1 Tax=Formosa sediminum TaxID=2594004 RepID=A0A516GUW4_9FLAO|nr:AAA family ATPase [Formosa sediminum]QDO95311.1 AAA family ATPase [Formosa sediminum]